MTKLTKNYVKSQLKKRDAYSNKNNYGHSLIIAGKQGYMGAAVIAAKAAIRAGTGLLTVCIPTNERAILQCGVPEAMLQMRENNIFEFDKYSAIGIGPGLGTEKNSEKLLTTILGKFKKPILLDADAINIIAKNKKLLRKIPRHTIITPHAGEFDRLFGSHKNNEERIVTAIQKAKEHNIIIVLKSHHTAIISSEELFINNTGNAGLAKGGSGDALTGIITSFLAQGYSPIIAANLGVYLHGLAADITLKEQALESMIITDVIENFGKAFKWVRK